MTAAENKEHEEVTRVATCPIHEISPMHPELLKAPWGMNRRLRDEAPVFQDPMTGIYFISRYEDVVKMAMDHKTFSSKMLSANRSLSQTEDPEIIEVLKSGYPTVDTMLTEDPPLQRRYRKFVDGAFSPGNLNALEPFIEATSNDLVDQFVDDGQCEFLGSFGVPLPLRVIVNQLGPRRRTLTFSASGQTPSLATCPASWTRKACCRRRRTWWSSSTTSWTA